MSRDILAAACSDSLTWPDAVVLLGMFACAGFVAWVFFR